MTESVKRDKIINNICIKVSKCRNMDNWAEVNLFTRPRRLEAGCAETLKQIEEKRYEELFLEEGIEHILKYGISFYKKKCKMELVI